MRKYYKFKINLIIGNVFSILFFVLALIPGYKIIAEFLFNMDLKPIGLVFLLYVFWIMLHEVLHGIGHILCGVSPKYLSFGASIEKSVLFCLVRKEVKKKGILISLIFPFFFIGVVTYIIGMIINSPVLVILSAFNISGASIDLLMFFHFCRLGSDITYIEPGDGTSFYIMSNKPINKLFGFDKLEEGTYTKDMFKDIKYKRWDISKTSIVMLSIFVVLSLIIMFL